MTEVEWMACEDPQRMLEFLCGKASDRKLRLFSVACCRAIWPLLDEMAELELPTCQPRLLVHERRILTTVKPLLDVAERYADGTDWSMMGRAYCDVAGLLHMRKPQQEPWAFAMVAVLRAVSLGGYYYGQEWERDHYDIYQCAKDAADYIAKVGQWIGTNAVAIHNTEAALVRCIFVPALFRRVTLEPVWLTQNVLGLAQAIYHDRAFDRMPILADALEETGCKNTDILAHCRGPGPHARGCWVVDLILGKK